ncbi:MAG: esterase-like activity of phytase family protein [Planctomycetia bacterium]
MAASCTRIAERLFFAAGVAMALTPFAGQAADGLPGGLHVEFRGTLSLPDEASTAGGGRMRLTGASGITWLGGDRFIAVMDNSASIVRLRLELATDGTPRSASDVEPITVAERHDYEDVAPRLGGVPALFLCEEDTPAIRMFRLDDGAAAGTIPLPPVARARRDNRGLESLALDPDGSHLWTANEEALIPDGGAVGNGAGTVVRLMRLPLRADSRPFQAAYRVEPPHDLVTVFAGPTLSGVVALVALGHGRLLVLERSAGPGLPPFESRLYLVDTSNAADVSGVGSDLAARPELVAGKTLVWSGALGLNLEGLCLGPKLHENRRALVGISDNGGLATPTQVVGFELSAVTSP